MLFNGIKRGVQLIAGCVLIQTAVNAQSTNDNDRLLKDSIDGRFDFSHFLMEAHGFIPVVSIITEPALGSLGGVVAPLFVQPKKVEGTRGYVPPDITAGVAMYTANGSYALGGLRSGSIPKYGIKYRVGLAYASINLSFYRSLPLIGEKEFSFNITSIPIFLSVSKKVVKQGVYLGAKYLYAQTIVKPNFKEQVPAFVSNKELNSSIGTMGVFVDWDKRNSIFTPDKGFVFNTAYQVNASWTASDYTYQRLNSSFNYFFPVTPNWISGLRMEGQHVFEKPPFYLLPGINMRGIPAARYQGASTILIETEQRYDVNLRWSIVGFVGYGKAIDFNQRFSNGIGAYSVGTGFRYLIARAFNMRTGIDIAKGPESFAWYIVFGHNWNR
jgi:hypothetical protein